MTKRFSILVISVLLVSGLVGGVYMFYQPNSENQDNGEEKPVYPFDVKLQEKYSSLNLSQPTGIHFSNTSMKLIFITELSGKVLVIQGQQSLLNATEIVDISDKIGRLTDEEGLVGFAFHPNFLDNGLFYLHYTTHSPTYTIISQYSFNHTTFEVGNETIMLKIQQPFLNHNGGGLVFGQDGLLYIGIGDGGAAYDPMNNSQNRTNLLGNILRIDVDHTDTGLNYSIPKDNPFVDNSNYRSEIFAYGVRNPYRMSIDQQSELIWFGDVGQDDREEINILHRARNYGWNYYEGSVCIQEDGCPEIGDHEPFFEYSHSVGNGIIGGLVYHGENIPALQGHYIFADWFSTDLFAIESIDPDEMITVEPVSFLITSITQDMNGEIYMSTFDGRIFELVAA